MLPSGTPVATGRESHNSEFMCTSWASQEAASFLTITWYSLTASNLQVC